MRQYNIVIIAFLCCATTVCNALPVANSKPELDIFNIPLSNGKELDVLTLGDESEVNERNKRTIGILRDLFPEISKQVEDQVNKLVAQLLRTLGPTILRTAIQGNSARRTSPVDDFNDDFDDDDKIEDEDSNTNSSSTSPSSTNNNNNDSATRIKVELPTFKPEDDDDNDDASNDVASRDSSTSDDNNNGADNGTKLTGGENSLDLNAINQQLEETIRVARQTNLNENALANSINSEAVNDVPNTKTDQQVSESKAPAIDELTLDSLDDGDDRNKRQGLFGGGGGSGGAGSGNFLFDIIRNTTKMAGEKVNKAYDKINGKNENQRISDENEYGLDNRNTYRFNLNHELDDDYDGYNLNRNAYKNYHANDFKKNSKQRTKFTNSGLFSGSVQSQGAGSSGGSTDSDSSSNSDDDNDDDNDNDDSSNNAYTEGIPGPVTRLVVLANRGLANLIQDLILRIAATSERLVNFKARLITALI